jgi:hypothetical protein
MFEKPRETPQVAQPSKRPWQVALLSAYLVLLTWFLRGTGYFMAAFFVLFGTLISAASARELVVAIWKKSPCGEAINYFVVGILQMIVGAIMFWMAKNATITVRRAAGPPDSLPFDEIK